MQTKQNIIFLIFVILPGIVLSQNPVKVCGETDYIVPENMSLREAKNMAIHQTQVQALISRFGQMIHEENTIVGSTTNGVSDESFYSFGGSEAKGEWIETIGEPVLTMSVTDATQTLVIHASVCGMAREIKSAGIEMSSTVLRNGTDARFESTDFKDGDNIYIRFQSPTDGYLCIYLLDPTAKIAYCLLPYRNSPDGAVFIRHDEEYLFFHNDNRHFHAQQADKIRMTCERDIEYNDLYIIFSPHRFAKIQTPNIADGMIPRISQEVFLKWHANCRSKDKDMVVKKHHLKIERSDQ